MQKTATENLNFRYDFHFYQTWIHSWSLSLLLNFHRCLFLSKRMLRLCSSCKQWCSEMWPPEKTDTLNYWNENFFKDFSPFDLGPQSPLGNQITVVAFQPVQLAQAWFLQKNQMLQNGFLIFVTQRWHKASVACKNQSF